MTESIAREIAAAVESESPRETRARDAAELIRASRGYRWVGIFDVSDDEVVLLGESGLSTRGAAVESRATVAGVEIAVVPILGAESGIVIGTLDAESEGARAFAKDEVAFLEECAAAMRPLYD